MPSILRPRWAPRLPLGRLPTQPLPPQTLRPPREELRPDEVDAILNALTESDLDREPDDVSTP